MAGRKKFAKKICSYVIFLIGLMMVSYPLVSALIAQQHQNDMIATYEKDVSEVGDDYILAARMKAEDYNRMLYQADGIVAGDIDTGMLSEENYDTILNLTDNGVMGSLEIPKIDVNLPIYHGTSEAILSVGIGHVKQSSFPIGGASTRAILTGHRGLPNAKLFTRLDEMEEGDMFFIRMLGETLAYQVCDIEVIKPEEVEALRIQENRDLVTLLTCHPYGINSHRLLVTGERAEYEEETYKVIESQWMSFREILFAVIPFIFAGIGIVLVIKNKKERRRRQMRDEKKVD